MGGPAAAGRHQYRASFHRWITGSSRVLALRLELHEIDDVDRPDLQVREMAPQQLDRPPGFRASAVPAARHDDIRLAALIVARPRPDAKAGGAVRDRRVHVQPLQRRLLAGDDDVDVVAAAQAVSVIESSVFASGGR